jgi:hypothetical protein
MITIASTDHRSSRVVHRWLGLLLLATGLLDNRVMALAVSLGTNHVASSSQLLRMPVRVSGGEAVTEMAVVVLVNGGGVPFGKLPGPRIVGIDFSGSIWGTNDAERVVFGDDPGGLQLAEASVALRSVGKTVAADGILFTVILDLAGLPPGKHSIELKSLDANVGGTEILRNGITLPASFGFGGIEIVDANGSSPFAVTPVLQPDGGLGLRFPGRAGHAYIVLASPVLNPPVWASQGSPIQGAGITNLWIAPPALLSGKTNIFFKIEEQ